MVIAHHKNTNIAKSPEAISDIINKYTEHKSYVFGYSYPNASLSKDVDILHLHNKNNFNFNKKIIQYHSEPFRVDLDVDFKKIVIAQYHATLHEYKDCDIVRNPIDLYDEIFLPKYQDKKIRIGYSPSTIIPTSIWADKGYEETIPILERIKNKYNDYVDIDIIINVSLEDCLYRKSLCNIFIDEVKTSSYHRSGLESLSMGIATICSLDKEVEKVLMDSSNSNCNPFINSNVEELETTLINLVESGISNLLEIGFNSRLWMEANWSPLTIAEEYIKLYKTL